MSSFKNAVKRRTHKERPQLSERRKYGLLEKHKDYVLRAKDYHRKEDAIRSLKEKATNRNPDEFYHKMINARTINGVHRRLTGNKQYSQEELLLMKSQDFAYILSKAQSEQKKVERLQAVLHSLDEAPVNKHVFFAEEREEANELKSTLSVEQQTSGLRKNLPKRIRKMQKSTYQELAERIDRVTKMKNMLLDMSLQKELMGKGRKRKLRDDEVAVPSDSPVYKWRRERKK